MKYLLKVKDCSGRDYSNVLSFNKEGTRNKRATEFLKGDGATRFEIPELLAQLERGESVEYEATEYEYLIQYEEDNQHD